MLRTTTLGTLKMDRARQDEDVTSSPSRIPVFVFPASIVFNAFDRDHLKQILTIYNPYEFPIRFKVLSTSPSYYVVTDPEGSIRSKNCVDLIIRLSAEVPQTTQSTPLEHKFRVQVYNYHSKQLLGRRDVASMIHFGNIPQHFLSSTLTGSSTESSRDVSALGSTDGFQQCPPGPSSLSRKGYYDSALTSAAAAGPNAGGYFSTSPHHPNFVAIVTALICIVGLMLPTNNEGSDSSSSSFLPASLHLSVNQKLLVAYTLGLVTMVIFRP